MWNSITKFVFSAIVWMLAFGSLAACTLDAAPSDALRGAAPADAAIPPGSDGSVLLTRHREGGIAGFCDDVTVYATGEVVASSCRGAQPVELGRMRLDPEQMETLSTWVDTLQPFELEQRDPAVADAMTVQLRFAGQGDRPATPEEQQAMLDFANELLLQVGSQATAPVPSPPPADAPALTPQDGQTRSMAIIEEVDVRILESFPVQVQVAVAGYLPDACTTIEEIAAVQEDDTFRIRVATSRPADAMCAQVITSFEEVVALDVEGLSAGEYTVQADGLSETFTLAVDNVQPTR
jgi:hypothetical protein